MIFFFSKFVNKIINVFVYTSFKSISYILFVRICQKPVQIFIAFYQWKTDF